MIVVDTNVWSELTRRTPERRVVEWERANKIDLRMSAIVLAEFRAGAALMAAGRNRSALEAVIEEIADIYADRLLPFEARCSAHYGVVLANARQAGKPIQAADAMIAATAMAHGMTVATRNVGDFAGTGIALINPWEV